MSGAINLRRAGAVLAIALVLIVIMLRHDTNVRAVGAAGSPISGQCVGLKQGVIKGDVTQKGREGTYAITAATHNITSPRDPATGQATGKRQHKPYSFVANISQATPKLITAMTTNETLTSCTFKFWKTDSRGVERNYFKIKLTNASVVDYSLSGRSGGADTVSFSLTYQKIEWTYVDGGITAEDDWEAPND